MDWSCKRQEELKANLERLRQEQLVKVQLLRQEMIRFYEAGEKALHEGELEQAIKDLERAVQIIAYSESEIERNSIPLTVAPKVVASIGSRSKCV